MPKHIQYYIGAFIALLFFLVGLGVGSWIGSGEVAETRRNLQAAEDRAVSLARELEGAEEQHRELEAALGRARGELTAAIGRAGELADQLERERSLLQELEDSFTESDGAVGRIDDLIGEGEGLIESLLSEEAP